MFVDRGVRPPAGWVKTGAVSLTWGFVAGGGGLQAKGEKPRSSQPHTLAQEEQQARRGDTDRLVVFLSVSTPFGLT